MRLRRRPGRAPAVADPPIEREEIVALLFNVADIAVTCGAFLMLFGMSHVRRHPT